MYVMSEDFRYFYILYFSDFYYVLKIVQYYLILLKIYTLYSIEIHGKHAYEKEHHAHARARRRASSRRRDVDVM